MSFPQSQQLLPNGQFRARRFPGSQQGMARRLDPALRLDLRFAVDGAFVSRRGPLPALTRASTGTFVGSNGLIQSAALNVPRIDFDPTNLSCLGLLIEEQRTNLLIHSENLTAANWGKTNVAVTGDTSVAPDGLSTADTVAETAVSGLHIVSTPSITPASGTAYAISVFLKKGPGATAPDWIVVGTSNQFPAFVVAFNVLTGQFGNVSGGASATYKAVQYANGWWRVSIVITASGSFATAPLGIYFSNNTNTTNAPSYLGKTTSDVLIWGAQVEAGAFASSYIPTTTTSVTRAADVCSYSGADFASFWRADEGTFVLELRKANRITSALSQSSYISINDGGSINYLLLCQRGQGVTGEVFRSEVSGVSQALFAAAPVRDANTAFRFGAAYRLNDFASAVNGSNCAVDTVATVPTVNQLSFVTVANALHIRELQYYATRKTNAQVTQLTRLPTTDAALTLDMQFAADATYFSRIGPLPTFTRASSARFVGSNGLIQVASTDVPRIDYDPITRACLGLLIEEQRQNLTIRSDDFGNAAWAKTAISVTSDNGVSPDGTTNADLLSETAVSSGHSVLANTLPAVTSGTVYTMSVFLKKGTGSTAPDWVILSFLTGGFGTVRAAFNVSTGVFGGSTGSFTSSVKQYTNGWYRVSMTATATATTAAGSMILYFSNNTNTTSPPTYTGQTTSDLFVWGAQFEAGSFATSYIPTTTTSLVRSADVCSITGAAFTGFYNQTEGAMVFKGDKVLGNNFIGTSGLPRYISFDDGPGSNRIHLWGYAGPNNYMVTAVGVDSASINTTAVTDGSRFAMAARYKANDFAVSQNAGAVLTDTTGPVPTVDRAGIGMAGNSGGSINGHIHTIQYFNAIKTDAQLQALSTP